MKKISGLAYLVLAFFIVNCSTSARITSTWKAPEATAKKFNKIMVLGIIREADRSIKEQMEDHLVGDLKELGYNAFSAYDVYGPKAFDGMTEQQANQKLAADGIDGVISVVLLDKQKERHYIPGRVVYSPYIVYHNHFWGYYHSIYTRIGDPGYYEITTKYFWESNLYDLTTNQLVFSVQTQSFDPESRENLAHEYGKKIVQAMVNANVLQKQENKVAKAM